MYAEERRDFILQRARRDGRVAAAQVAAELGVTSETVRRDLSVLERKGLLRRTHGGALPVERLTGVPDVPVREKLMSTEKGRIAKAALAELPEAGGSVIIDAGTTTAHIVEHLLESATFTAITNSLPIGSALMERPGIDTFLIGGRLRHETQGTIDDWALHALCQITVDVAFIAANGVSVEHGLTTTDTPDAVVKRAMMGAARHLVVLADRTKIGADYLARFADLADIDLLITDAGLDPELADQIEAAGPRVIRA
jgi:DeoR family transcriptional regulator, fructose operon transcriptional repressor